MDYWLLAVVIQGRLAGKCSFPVKGRPYSPQEAQVHGTNSGWPLNYKEVFENGYNLEDFAAFEVRESPKNTAWLETDNCSAIRFILLI